MPHFDAKGEADKFFIEAGVPTTFLYPSFYWENFIYFGAGPKKAADGTVRKLFAVDIQLNAVHGSDSDENAEKEIAHFFSKDELLNNYSS